MNVSDGLCPACPGGVENYGGFPASDANTVINNFNALSKGNQEAILVFLRSL